MLVNSAGTSRAGAFEEIDIADFKVCMDLDQLLVKYISDMTRNHHHIVMISSSFNHFVGCIT